MEDIAGWSAVQRKIGARLPLSTSGMKSIGGAGWSWSGRTTGSSLSLRRIVSDLLLAIREVDEVIVRKSNSLRDFGSGGARCHVMGSAT